MRRHYLIWAIAVFGIFGTVYGAYLLVYHFGHGNGLNVPSLILLIFGALALLTFLVLYISSLFTQKKKKNEPTPIVIKKEEEPAVEKK